LKTDLPGTLKEVAADGYSCVEFFASYHDWTVGDAKDVRKRLDDLNLRCYSTHNHLDFLGDPDIGYTIELNHVIGSKYIVVASPGKPATLDDWKAVAEKLNRGATKLEAQSLYAGYHNHDLEFRPLDGTKPMEILAHQTGKEVMLQLDVGTCLEAGSDPVEWIRQNPGRIRSMHCKDWSKQQGYEVLLGEGVAPWPQIFKAAESVGGLEYYLIEQEGSRYSPFETAKRCLASFRTLHSQST
jgi:sugar phosphate isomerase/epimerase